MVQEQEKPKKKTFVILVDGVFYMTDGKLLTYDKKAAGAEPDPVKRKEKEEGVEKVKKKFQEEVVSDHTAYVAVGFDDPHFKPVNTGESA
ncbi:hypothetical protein [Sphingomicrobium astaxanthinifaciens]|uniref:hypothetical protein n=1 Tax=Sphingomicrobium astaxanthinifaciens TaxID=1227949 RepID=UPI001FCB357B|nr:hypothetical protein [Sphingomicrobium astaxanthinifaciens]MCJ7420242.1 hypothetical protein [Sphingomicrobium astaxanthinifaciens]